MRNRHAAFSTRLYIVSNFNGADVVEKNLPTYPRYDAVTTVFHAELLRCRAIETLGAETMHCVSGAAPASVALRVVRATCDRRSRTDLRFRPVVDQGGVGVDAGRFWPPAPWPNSLVERPPAKREFCIISCFEILRRKKTRAQSFFWFNVNRSTVHTRSIMSDIYPLDPWTLGSAGFLVVAWVILLSRVRLGCR